MAYMLVSINKEHVLLLYAGRKELSNIADKKTHNPR